MKTKKLMSCANLFEAQVIQGSLEAEGIGCLVKQESAYGVIYPQLFVDEDNYERAREIVIANGNEIN